jgi:glycosyltransferase involved in cell wall biosynthesis
MLKNDKISLVIPCYNEEKVILQTHSRINSLIENAKNCEIIYVDDGSKDATLEILKKIAAGDPGVKIIRLSRNFGHQAALLAGMLHASGDAVISLDADLQDPPEIIPAMLEKYDEGFDLVFGVRKKRAADNLLKRFTGELFYKLMNSMGVNVIFNHADFRLISKKALQELKKYSESNLFLRGLIPSLGFNQTVVYYEREARFAGQTKYPLGKMISFAIEGITSFTYLPLRLASFMGMSIALLSLLLSFWSLFTKLAGNSVPGWTSTVLPMYFLGGIQLLFLGIMGEYIGKIYLETKRRPPFIIQEKYNFDDAP